MMVVCLKTNGDYQNLAHFPDLPLILSSLILNKKFFKGFKTLETFVNRKEDKIIKY